MSQSSDTHNVASWNRDQVKYWLELKGIGNEIQDVFHQEAIDGEALLYLREQDIENLISRTSTPFGIRRKLATYIGHLQILNNKPSVANPYNLSSSLSPTVINNPFAHNYHSPDSNLLNFRSPSLELRKSCPLSMSPTNIISSPRQILTFQSPPQPINMIQSLNDTHFRQFNHSQSLSTFDSGSTISKEIDHNSIINVRNEDIVNHNGEYQERLNDKRINENGQINVDQDKICQEEELNDNSLSIVASSMQIDDCTDIISRQSDNPSVSHHENAINNKDRTDTLTLERSDNEQKTQRVTNNNNVAIKMEYGQESQIIDRNDNNKFNMNCVNHHNQIITTHENNACYGVINTNNDNYLHETDDNDTQMRDNATSDDSMMEDADDNDDMDDVLFDDKLQSGKYAIQSTNNNSKMQELKARLLAEKRKENGPHGNGTEMKSNAIQIKQELISENLSPMTSSSITPLITRKRKRKVIEDDDTDDDDTVYNNNRPLRKRSRHNSPTKRCNNGHNSVQDQLCTNNSNNNDNGNDNDNNQSQMANRKNKPTENDENTSNSIKSTMAEMKAKILANRKQMEEILNTNPESLIRSAPSRDEERKEIQQFQHSTNELSLPSNNASKSKTKRLRTHANGVKHVMQNTNHSANTNDCPVSPSMNRLRARPLPKCEKSVKMKRKLKRDIDDVSSESSDDDESENKIIISNKWKNEEKKFKQKCKKEGIKRYRYSEDNDHNTSNHGKRWSKDDLRLIWYFHYECNWDNMKIAKKFKRTDCGIMVQLDKMYKDKRDKEDLVNKKYLYQQNVDKMIKGEAKWSEKERKWIKTEKANTDNNNGRFDDSDDSDDDSDSDDDDDDTDSDSDDDDIPIAILNRKRKNISNNSNDNENSDNVNVKKEDVKKENVKKEGGLDLKKAELVNHL